MTESVPTGEFRIQTGVGYSLAASIRFLEGFAPAAYTGDDGAVLRLAFVADGLDRAEHVGGAAVTQDGATVLIETYGDADPARVRDQVTRILSLDVDGSGFRAVGERDPVVRRLQAGYAGLRPVLFHSPYEAAAWCVIGNRIRIVQAAKLKARMAEEVGKALTVRGERLPVFPAPSRLAGLEEFPGLFGRKVEYSHAVADAAAAGDLEAERLRGMSVDAALSALKTIKGIGDFAAQLILLRGTGSLDALPTSEPRLARAVEMAYALGDVPDNAALHEIAEGWRPYRTWVALLLRTMLEDETGEIAGRSAGWQPPRVR